MSNQSKLSSKEMRAKHAKWLRTRKVRGKDTGNLAEDYLEEPRIPDYWQGDAEWAGYVPRSDQDKDMALVIPGWESGAPDDSQQDTLTLEWKPNSDVAWVTVDTFMIPGPPVIGKNHDVTLNKANFSTAGTYNLRYRVFLWSNNDNSSRPVNIIIDHTGPHYGQEPPPFRFKDDAINTDGITEEYLAANRDSVTVLIPVYFDQHPTDIVEVFIDGDSSDPDRTPVFRDTIDTTLREALIPGDRIRALINNDHLFVDYRLTDIIGNIGDYSQKIVAELFLTPLPTTPLVAPRVPLAEDSEQLIDLDDVRSPGVQVLIELYDNWESKDVVEVNWGGEKFLHPVGTTPEDLIVIPVPWTVLQLAYGVNTGPTPTSVSYEVIRLSKRFASGSLPINVDLSLAGPVNPDPDPVNPALVAVTVKGGSGNSADNVLADEDKGMDATAEVELYTPLGTGERMTLCWGSPDAEVATYDPNPANDTPGKTITFTIEWADIAKAPGQSSLPVFYTLGKIAGGNIQHSLPQTVDVTGALPITFAEPTFPDAAETSGGQPILNCSSYIGDDHHVRVKIPANPAFLNEGDTVTITWQAYDDFDGTNAIGLQWKKDWLLTADEAENGFEVIVEPYAAHIETVGSYGSVRVTYSATINGNPGEGKAHIWASSTRPSGPCYP